MERNEGEMKANKEGKKAEGQLQHNIMISNTELEKNYKPDTKKEKKLKSRNKTKKRKPRKRESQNNQHRIKQNKTKKELKQLQNM